MSYNCYSKNVVKDGKYLTIRVEENITSEKEIIQGNYIVFKVTHTGGYGRIKVSDGVNTFNMCNPFTYYFGKLTDARLSRIFYAECDECDKVLDMTNAEFNLDGHTMALLHNRIFIPKQGNDYWIELTDEQLLKTKD